MSWWEEAIRGLLVVPTGGMSEVVGRKNKLGRTVTGGLEGGAGGFITGGPVGAGMGAATGAGLSGTGTTDPYKLKGGAINFGSGMGAGGLGHAGMSMFGGSGGMSPYMPTSSPNMGAAGSTLGPGGMGSPLNPMSGAAPTSAGTASPVSQALQMMRGMPMGGQGQQQQAQSSPQDILQKLYKMFPGLRPGAHVGQGMNMGGSSGY